MTLNKIEILIHYFVSDAAHPKIHAPAVKEACEEFCELGLLASYGTNGVYYKANREALRVYVDALLIVPLPTKKWIIISDVKLKEKK